MVPWKRPSSWTIPAKLFLLILVSFLPVLAMIVADGLEEREDQIEKAREEVELLVQSLASQQERITAATGQMLGILAQLPEVQRLDVQVCNELFRKLCLENSFYSMIGAATPEGQIIASYPPVAPSGVSVADRSHIREVRETHELAIGQYNMGRVSKAHSFNYAHPVLDAEKRLIGIVIAGFKLDQYSAFIAEAKLKGHFAVTIADRNGVRLYRSPQQERIPPGKPIPEELRRRIQEVPGQGSCEERDEEGVHRYYAFKPLRLKETAPPYLYLMAGVSRDDVVRQANFDMARNLFILLIVTGLTMSVAWGFGQMFFIRPVRRLASAARRLGKGEMGTRTGLSHDPSELGEMAHAFDDMASLLETRSIERKNAEEELRKSEEKYRGLFETLLDVYYRIDTEGRVVMVSPSIALAGYAPEEVIGSKMEDFFELPGEREKLLEAAGRTGRVENHECRVKRKNGLLVWASFNARLLKDEAGNTLGFEGIARNITPRKQAEEELNRAYAELEERVRQRTADLERTNAVLQESEQRYKSLYRMIRLMCDNAPDLVWAKDMEKRFIFVNAAMCLKLLNAVDTDEPIGRTDLYFAERERSAHPGRPDWHTFGEVCVDSDAVVMSSGYAQRFDEYGCVQGKPLFLDVYKAPIRDESGTMIGTVGCGRDCTREKELEEERRKSKEERKKLEARLHQAQKLEAMGTLAGGIAHDFNNILSPIIGYTEMALGETPPANPRYEDLEQVLQAAHRARDLVQQILAFCRPGGEQQRVPLEMGPIVEEALKLMRASLPSTIEIRQQIEPGDVLADATQIHQILINLCTNAAQAMSNTGVIEVSLTKVEMSGDSLDLLSIPDLKPGKYLRLRVSDSGGGMDAATVERIFDPYFTTKETGKGSGLGLSIVHGIVKRHKGAVTVRSAIGEGTVFDVYLPSMEAGVRRRSAQMRLPLPTGTERILLVDDERLVIEMGAKILKRLGYQVTSSRNAMEAIGMFQSGSERFDLVITDYTMPHLTGSDLVKEIRRLQPNIPILLCTGFSENVGEKTAGELGVEIVMKPFGMRLLAESVRRALDAKKI